MKGEKEAKLKKRKDTQNYTWLKDLQLRVAIT
jgi:hypothetical protein